MPAGGVLFTWQSALSPASGGTRAARPCAIVSLNKKNQKINLRETAFLLKISFFDFSFETQALVIFRLPPEGAWF